MDKTYKLITLLIITFMIISCGESNPPITKIVVKSDRVGVLLDTEDPKIIADLQTIFYEKEERPDAGPEFRYFIDFTIDGNSERWQYSEDGHIRSFESAFTMIYQLRDVAEFNKIAKIR